ncbi:hypothetical protein Golob_018277 [Gossypium lobatum]|uniref:Uncharacterized protein n=1 Tax=Gossypium lobatum TaxID=34289 RepID=A0A7J8M9Q0_9ROSI|nr:hypothetical protein [Gossypium lobatum]
MFTLRGIGRQESVTFLDLRIWLLIEWRNVFMIISLG